MKKSVIFLVTLLLFSCNGWNDYNPKLELQPPELSHSSGSYQESIILVITTDYSDLPDFSDQIMFKYTLDGTDPKTSSTALTTNSSITLSHSATLQIFAYIESGIYLDSKISVFAYTIQ